MTCFSRRFAISFTAVLLAVCLTLLPAFWGGDDKEQDARAMTPSPLKMPTDPADTMRMRTGAIELVDGPPWFLYQRSPPDRPNRTSMVRVACLYVGFMRDYQYMLMKPPRTVNIEKKKFYGNQQASLLDPLDCDVFITTWNIGGKGRYNTYRYDEKDILSPSAIQKAYGRRLSVLHIQKYKLYEPLWGALSHYLRNFTEAYPVEAGSHEGQKMWRGAPRYRPLFRTNDYSQSYKHWVAVRLVDRFPILYDLYYRLRPDLRTSQSFYPIQPLFGKGFGFRFQMSDSQRWHLIDNASIHVHAPDYSDFGFLGSPTQIRHIAQIWPQLCLANGVPKTPQILQSGARELHADYNRVVWQWIFEKQWRVDFGYTYLHVSRRYGETLQSLSRRKKG